MSEDRESLLLEIKLLRAENEALKRDKNLTLDLDVVSQNDISSFSLEEYLRYGRQMLVPTVGIQGQIKLKQAKVLVIGAGGLGSPLLLYLAAGGVGHIGIVDNDTVDVSNLHRQVIHTSDNVGLTKCQSLKNYLNKLNPYVEVELFEERLSGENVFDIFEKRDWDLILDCTDTPLTRYFINDAAVICGITIVSGSGVKTDGQLSLLNFENRGPCYRCFYPNPPPLNSVLSCQDGGVVGPAIGVVGTMMALETIKVLCGEYDDDYKPFLNVYSGVHYQSMKMFKMRGKAAGCVSCGEQKTITREMITSGELNYAQWCGRKEYDVASDSERITVKQLSERLAANPDSCLVVDVRPKVQFDICHLDNSVSIPWDTISRSKDVHQLFEGIEFKDKTLYCICRFGNDSRLSTRFLKDNYGISDVYDVIGGVNKWAEDVDVKFPKY